MLDCGNPETKMRVTSKGLIEMKCLACGGSGKYQGGERKCFGCGGTGLVSEAKLRSGRKLVSR